MTMLLDQATRKPRQHPVPMHRDDTNNKLGWALLLVLGLSPLPLGSNRPAFWAAWGVLLGGIGVVYFLSLRANGSALRVQPLRLPELTIPFMLLVLFVAVQTLPLGILGLAPPRVLPIGPEFWPSSISLDPATTSLTLLQFASYGLMALLCLQIGFRGGRANRVLIGIFLIIVAYALLGLVLQGQLIDILGLPRSPQTVATGPFVNRNSYATYLSLGLALGVALAVGHLEGEAGQNRHRKVVAIALIAAGLFVIGAALVATQSRMGFFAGLIGALSVTVLALSRRRATVWLIALSALLVATLGLLVLNGSGLLERVGSLETAGDVRADLYRQVWGMILSSPWVGYGAGTFELAFPLFHQLPVSPDVVWNKAHSTYLSLWVELGFLFGSLPLFIVAAAALRLVRSASRGAAGAPRLAAIGVIAVVAVHSAVDFSLEIQAVAFTFIAIVFLAIGAGLGVGEQRRHHA